MGQSGKRRKKGRMAKSAATAPVASVAEKDTKITVDVHMGGIEFLEGSRKLDSANGLAGGDTGPHGSLRYELAWADKSKAVEWFKAGCDQDSSAEMWFSAALSKDQRKELHMLCSSSCPSLKSVSCGSEDARQIGIVHSSNTKWDAPILSDADEKKARALLSYLRDSGQTVSVDEVRGMIAGQKLSVGLNATANKLLKDQQNVDALLDAVDVGDTEPIQTLLSSEPGAVNVKQCDTGKLPLHTAAAAGNIAIMDLLVRAGALLEQEDGKGSTPLEAARRTEQCDAEGWLLQQGAHDHAAQFELTEAADIGSLDPADASAMIDNRTVAVDEPQIRSTEGDSPGLLAQTTDAEPANHDAVGPATPDPEEPETSEGNRCEASTEVQLAAPTPAAAAPESAPREDSRNSRVGTAGVDVAAAPDGHEYVKESAQGTSSTSGTHEDNGAMSISVHGAKPEASTCKPNRVPEIEPAPPRPSRVDDVEGDFEMSIQQDEENGLDVLVAWAGNAATTVSDFCGKYPALVATASAMLAVVGAVVVKVASSSRR